MAALLEPSKVLLEKYIASLGSVPHPFVTKVDGWIKELLAQNKRDI